MEAFIGCFFIIMDTADAHKAETARDYLATHLGNCEGPSPCAGPIGQRIDNAIHQAFDVSQSWCDNV